MTLKTANTLACKGNMSPFLASATPGIRSRHVVARAEQQAGGSIRREVIGRVERTKLNNDDDREWYSMPRIVQHSDDSFRRQLTQLYRERIPDGGAVLDLCSSWVSHLPKDHTYATVVGHGLNAAELARNPQLSRFFVRNLNLEPGDWALGDCSFDAVLMCCSIQYIEQPEIVFAEMYRVLKPGGVAIISFTNRMFWPKAIAVWREGTEYSRVQLVKQYFGCVDGFTNPEAVTHVATDGKTSLLDGAWAAVSKLLNGGVSDPFYAVMAYRDFKRK